MDIPSFYISSAINNVDVTDTKKIVYLPPASTILGQSLWVHDKTGAGFFSTIFVSTIGVDTIDFTYGFNTLNTYLEIAGTYVSRRFIAQSTTNYSIIGVGFNNSWVPS